MNYEKIMKESAEIIINENYEKDVHFTINYSRILLSFLGIWPLISKSNKIMEKIIFTFVRLLGFLLITFTIVPCLVHTIFQEKDIQVKLQTAGPLSFQIFSALKFGSIIYHREMIANCINHIERDWKNITNEADWKIMRENIQVGRNLTAACAIFLYLCSIIFNLVMPLCTAATINEFNETLRNLFCRPAFDSFIDLKNSPNYEFILFTYLFGVLLNSTAVIASLNLAAIFVAHACGQFQIIISRLDSLLDLSSDVNNHYGVVHERIKFAVSNHVRVLGFSTKIEQVLREICCIEVVSSTLMICLDEYYCMLELNNRDAKAILTYGGLFVTFSLNIFLYCFIGEWLKEQGSKIEEAAYMSDWYKLPDKSGLAMVMIMSTINYHPKLTAGKIIELSISSFASIMKTTFAYFNMLRTMGF